MKTHPVKNIKKRAFTLIELLVVMAIMLIIMGFVIFNFSGFSKASNLTNGASNFVDQLNQARQLALADNRSVEVRFYYLPGPTDGTTATAYRGMRTIVCDVYGNTSTNNGTITTYASGAQPNPIQRLPTGVRIYTSTAPGSGGTYFTTLLPAMSNAGPGVAPTATWSSSVTTGLKPAYGTEYFPGSTNPIPVAYIAFQFKPNGGTNLDPNGTGGNPSDKWFMTFVSETDKADTTNSRPTQNFITVVVDPFTGRVKLFRPT
jgi:prepilin-type N-terminal cleavage/methylation domain-containing protein